MGRLATRLGRRLLAGRRFVERLATRLGRRLEPRLEWSTAGLERGLASRLGVGLEWVARRLVGRVLGTGLGLGSRLGLEWLVGAYYRCKRWRAHCLGFDLDDRQLGCRTGRRTTGDDLHLATGAGTGTDAVVLLHRARGLLPLCAKLQSTVDHGNAAIGTAGIGRVMAPMAMLIRDGDAPMAPMTRAGVDMTVGVPARSPRCAPPSLAVAAAVAVALLAGCATVPSGPGVLVLPGPQATLPQFQADQAMCQQYAQSSVGVSPQDAAAQSAAASALVGAAIGAAAGAIMGSAYGNAGEAAAWGAGTGLLFGSAAGANAAGFSAQEAQRRYDAAYLQCMYANGHQIPGRVAMRAPPQRAVPAIPPPNTPPPNLGSSSPSGGWQTPSGYAAPAPPAGAPVANGYATTPGAGGYATTPGNGARVPAPRLAPPSAATAAASPSGSSLSALPAVAPTAGYGTPPGPVQPGPPLTIVPPGGTAYPPSAYPPPGTPPPAGAN